ncbi:MAG: Cyclic pyranopterin monophosphate synthase [Alphaproteobacteria bacterium MarineAlpha5_Bin8]|nr:MAG: Cyclic pyranopterin monophosphate synthase [Alphaproteobacteria bacterium MarineAlpha5_Bin8]PPR45968.1 MAG: Cyclic pyranopterin monophosphate synthase [Alphaproteobacteria bacterium MarineAlpha5_Bin7]PPR54006.1 MAG: Cyclic pyranopterin monophosphate synthase [Alphaproteobacteria bacterium MarineAlpha5_Bin6]|tara:strand:+ start:259 stop:1251 length:993 start_codon:yes stop_codon:yes gene_type:complete
MTLTDQFHRKVNYLRVSVTDRCDLRCIYCMKEKMDFLPKKQILTLEEIERLCDNFIDLGVTKIRLTGGEPLVRKNIIELIKKLNIKKNSSNLKEIVLTTNGTLLSEYAYDLKKNGINRINVSLDTIDQNKYNKITRFGDLNKVLLGIEKALEHNIKIKINLVAIKNFNENEFCSIIDWANQLKIDLSFIEVMPMQETDIARHLQYMPLNRVFDDLNEKYKFYKSEKNTGGPSRYYKSPNLSINVGFISPITNNFCSNCNRIRISSTGKLYMCLGQNDYIDFREILRNDYNDNYIKEKIKLALKIKPLKHDFMINKNSKTYMQRHMNVTGG